MGGKYEPGNVIAVEITACNKTTANHVMWHYANWQLHGKEEDKLAYKGLSGFYSKEEIIFQQLSAAGKMGGKNAVATNRANGTGYFHDPKIHSANGKKAAELKVGCHAPGMAAKGANRTVELKVGVHARPAEQMTADGLKGVLKQREEGTGRYSSECQSKLGKKGGAATSSQRWQCLVTDHISTPAGLSNYQRARGIDTKLRVKLVIQSLSS
jgi:hypothetical protein